MHEIKIYGDIVPFGNYDGVFSIENLSNQLSNLSVVKSDDVIVSINTYGGDVATGFSIYNILRRFAKENEVTITTRLDGYCASIGTVILLAGDKRIGNQYASPFVHNAWQLAAGDAEEMKKVYLDLEKCTNDIAKFYSEKINIDFETAKQLMQDETWIEPAKALEYGFFTELENNETPAKAFYNLLKENNLLRNTKINNNQNEKKMTIAEKVNKFMKETFGIKNKILFDAENNEVDFYELEDGATPKVGDKANLKGSPADGEIIMTTGETFVFDKGTLSEIKEKVADDTSMVALQAENDTLKAENDALKANAIEASNKLTSATTFINSLKHLTSEVDIDDDKKNQNHRNNSAKPSAFSSAIKNVK